MFNFLKPKYKFDVVGLSHHKKNLNAVDLEDPEHMYPIELIPEPTNKVDKNAIKVLIDGRHIGYVPVKKCYEIHAILRKGIKDAYCYIGKDEYGYREVTAHIRY